MTESEKLVITLPASLYNQSNFSQSSYITTIQEKGSGIRNLKTPNQDFNPFSPPSAGEKGKINANMHLFMTSLLDQYHHFLCKYQCSHPTFQLVHQAVGVVTIILSRFFIIRVLKYNMKATFRKALIISEQSRTLNYHHFHQHSTRLSIT